MVRETHFAFVGVDSVTMMELKPESWYSREGFATTEALALRWYLLLKNIVPGSENSEFPDQKAMLPKEYEVPSAVAETAKDILIYKKTGVCMNPARYARTSDLDSVHRRVCISGGVDVYSHWDDGPYDFVGIGASRWKFDQTPAA